MILQAEDRRQMPTVPVDPLRKSGDGDGPGKPDVKRPDTSDLLKRMKRVDGGCACRERESGCRTRY